MIDRKIKDLTEKEFTNLLQEFLSGNSIEIGGVIVSSQRSSLKEVEETINKLLEKHKNFLLLRKETQIKLGARGE